MTERFLLTGGGGFVGSNLAVKLKEALPGCELVALDNLKRRGSELSIARLREWGVKFIHGDVRNPEDIEGAGPFDILLECSAEPSVQAGYDGDPRYLLNTNLQGTVNCLEAARKCEATIIFLSTSRVYPIQALRALPLEKEESRLAISKGQRGRGWSESGITTDFPLTGRRSMYGASKLCSELIIEEYADMYGLSAITNRCGVIAGPWQMGKVDQGFFTFWAAKHFFGGRLSYKGFGGLGLQVRDILHIDDLFELIRLQLSQMEACKGSTFNVGGGRENSVSLRELTTMCSEICGAAIPIDSLPETHPADIPYYVSDNTAVSESVGWSPRRTPKSILEDILAWIEKNACDLEGLLV